MAVCPKCSYALVILPKRLRYKCAKCGGLYLQKPIEDREFQRWNQKQKEFTREESEREFEQLWDAYKNLYKPKKQQKLAKEKRPELTEEEKKQKRKEYYLGNKEEILERNRV